MIKALICVVALTAIGSFAGWMYTKAREPLKKEIATAKAQASAVQAARVTEQTIIKADVAASKTYQEGLQDGKRDLNAAIAKLRAERVRYRAAAGASLSSNPAPASGCYAEAGTDISEEIARIGAEADDVARQLTAAQELLRNR
ncbi:gp16 putative lysis protein/holin [Iodobacter phage PhiPLPE]|uniref:Gp16 putative lysis protein/holin n=1 Tax=Iodobacter phage PhiPLPE TaxID=551895 RepID=B5AX35_9CAUD|nr:Rz-like spanin [Iodobacter phage PhiPLPE]ACG60338.1 gp16 putative lysis protein/holin [Iodobacter phage PhiPLPE]